MNGVLIGDSIKEIILTRFGFDKELMESNIHHLIYNSVVLEKMAVLSYS